MTPTRVTVGTQFRAVIADCNALWETKTRVKGGWRCVCVNEPIKVGDKTYPGEYAGQVKLFTDREISQSVGMANLFDGIMGAGDRLFAAKKPGDIVHYHNGFGDFVRYEMQPDRQWKPIALVGNWKNDLPRRCTNGSIYYPYHAKAILTGELRDAPGNVTTIYETMSDKARFQDPATMQPVDLTLPPMTEAEEAQAKLWQAIDSARKALESGTPGDAKRMLTTAKVFIDSALNV